MPVFPPRTNLKLYNSSASAKIVKKVKANLDSSKVSSPDKILVVVLKNCEPKLSYILTKLNLFLTKLSFLWLVKSL